MKIFLNLFIFLSISLSCFAFPKCETRKLRNDNNDLVWVQHRKRIEFKAADTLGVFYVNAYGDYKVWNMKEMRITVEFVWFTNDLKPNSLLLLDDNFSIVKRIFVNPEDRNINDQIINCSDVWKIKKYYWEWK